MKPALLNFLIPTFFFTLSVNAQKELKDYKDDAEDARKEVWAWNRPEFNMRNVPAQYNNASKIVVAKRVEISTDEAKKVVRVGLGAMAFHLVILTETTRELIKINDKSALSEYSEISFTQWSGKKSSVSSVTSYVGARVIKPDGSIKEINAKDIVITNDQDEVKEAKIAVPDLQVGDMLDYFIRRKIAQNRDLVSTVGEYALSLFAKSPILNYSFKAEIGDNYAVEYKNYNGAPFFKTSKGSHGSNILEFSISNILAYPEMDLWVSAFRQLPIIRMNILLPAKGLFTGRTNQRDAGEIYQYKNSDEFIQDEKIAIGAAKSPNSRTLIMLKDYSDVPAITLGYFKQLSKNKDNLPPDSLAAELFYIYRFNYLDFSSYNSIEGIINSNKTTINNSKYAYGLSDFFKIADLDNRLVFVSSMYSPELKNIMSKNEIQYLVLTPGQRQKFFGMEDIFTNAFFIPAQYENIQQAITLDTKGRKTANPKDFDQGTINVPSSIANQNVRTEKLTITPNSNSEYVSVDRVTTLTGHFKSDEQKRLILVEDYCNAERKKFGATETITQELAKDKKSKKFAEELQTAFDNARKKQKDAFLGEAKDWFEQDITDLTDTRIENMGVRHTNPDFIYRSAFKMGGVLKKAGNNLIIEVGKLQGTPLNISSNQRKRSLDIYMPFARIFETEVTIQIPDGYTVDGIAALNKKVENETGSFSCDAAVNGKTVTIKVKKSYNHAFEPAANWDKLLAFIDAANDWGNAKILLKKM